MSDTDSDAFNQGRVERQRWFDQQAARLPSFEEQQEKADRVIPVVVLAKA